MTEKKPAHKPPAEKEKPPAKPHHVQTCLHPIVQPAYVNHQPAACTPICTTPAVPQPTDYVTCLDPVFLDHLSRHQDQRITVRTTVETLEGVLASVAVDHIQLNRHDKAFHIRTAQIVYFEGLPISYL